MAWPPERLAATIGMDGADERRIYDDELMLCRQCCEDYEDDPDHPDFAHLPCREQ